MAQGSHLGVWVEAARPRTLPAALAPVVVGTAAAAAGEVVWWRAGAALVVALAVQVAVNFANDYSDAARGVDTDERLGPRRAVAAGLVSRPAMRLGIAVALTVAGVAGFALAAATTWWLLAVGGACLLAALGYSGGPKPYASAALGEMFVFAFFGLVATVGSAFVHLEQITAPAVAASVPVGLLAVALLLVNNLRDIPTDAPVGKRTLAVRLGDARSRRAYLAVVAAAFAALAAVVGTAMSAWPLLGLLAAPLAVRAARPVLAGAQGPALISALGATAACQLALAALLAAGLLLGLG